MATNKEGSEGGKKEILFGFIPVPEQLRGKERWFVYGGLALVVAAAL